MNIQHHGALVLGLASASACAQSAIITISHDDPDGIVTPGQVVELSVQIASTQTLCFAEIRGEVLTSPNVGIAMGGRFGAMPVPGGPAAVLQMGTPSLGSLLDIRVASNDGSVALGWSPPAPWWYNPLRFLQFDWTAPATPGVVEFDWGTSATLPEPLFCTLPWATAWPPTPVPTTYVGTSLTVIPGPGGIMLIGLGLAGGVGRRHRPVSAR